MRMRRLALLAKEPSTWAGIAASFGGIGIMGWSEDQWLQAFGAVATVAGLVAAVLLDPADERKM